MVKPFVPKDVVKKIQLASGEEASREMLIMDIEVEDIPKELGGLDEYIFNANEYYGEPNLTEEESMRYMEEMPWQT